MVRLPVDMHRGMFREGNDRGNEQRPFDVYALPRRNSKSKQGIKLLTYLSITSLSIGARYLPFAFRPLDCWYWSLGSGTGDFVREISRLHSLPSIEQAWDLIWGAGRRDGGNGGRISSVLSWREESSVPSRSLLISSSCLPELDVYICIMLRESYYETRPASVFALYSASLVVCEEFVRK